MVATNPALSLVKTDPLFSSGHRDSALVNGKMPSRTSQSDEGLTLTSSRSFNVLCSDNRQDLQAKWHNNGYKATSRSTDDLLEDIKSRRYLYLLVPGILLKNFNQTMHKMVAIYHEYYSNIIRNKLHVVKY